jgi:DNA repair protein RadC
VDYTVKDMPESEQPREKLRNQGVDSLTEVDLLSIIIRTGTRGKNVKQLCSEILSTYSLDELANRTMEDMKQFEGVSNVKAGQLVAAAELSKRMKNESREKIEKFSDVQARVQDMKFLEEEKLRVFHLNSGNEILEESELDGLVSKVSFDLKNIFRQSVKRNAAAVILAHNHPSGNSKPTETDVEMTEEAVETGETIGVDVLDHVIVGDDVLSMKSHSTVDF